jgi:iron complex transport system ATP-binding protein
LRGVELTLEAGTLTALLGPNGSGKSTLLRLLAGVLRADEGSVSLTPAGDPPFDPGRVARDRAARHLAFLPARPQVPVDYSALEVVLMGRHPHGRGRLLEEDRDVALAEAALERAGALPFRDRVCAALSSGERQRVLLARVLCQSVPALLLDEPTSAQDPAHALDLFGLLSGLARDEGKTVVVATHDLNAASRFADRLVVLQRGARVADGAPSEVLTPELLGSVFEVEALLGDEGGRPYVVPKARKR